MQSELFGLFVFNPGICVCVCVCVLYCAMYTRVAFLVCCASLSMEYCNNYEAHLILYETTEVPLIQ